MVFPTRKDARKNVAAVTDHRRSRRWFLASAAGTLAGLTLAARSGHASLPDRRIELTNPHTGERLNTVFWADGEFVPEAMAEISVMMRDFRSGEVKAIDPDLIEIVYRLRAKLGTRAPIQVVSGYRSAETTAKLLRAGENVARHSFHILGRALDLRVEKVATNDLRRAALALNAGGVGYYPKSGFVHVDTGPVRRW